MKAVDVQMSRESALTHSTSSEHDLRSGAVWLASEPLAVQEAFLSDLSADEMLALPYLFEFWALPHQLPPEGCWRSWVIMGGRGAGKTRAGAEWVRSIVEGPLPDDPGECRRIALIGETFDQVRDVMIFGESGILACSPPDRVPDWQASKRMLVWPNGASAQAFSAHEPEGLRGPQFDAAWVDELAKWKRAEDTWDMLQFALRLGDNPRQCVTTTPRNVGILKRILNMPTTVVTHARTEENRANIAESFLLEVRARYAGTRLGMQELDGVLLEESEDALWKSADLEATHVPAAPDLDRIVVAVDPPVGSGPGSDACGIVVAGIVKKGPPQQWRAYVLEDATIQGHSPKAWAEAAIAAFHRHGADRLVAEVNQGGSLVETVVRSIDPLVPYRAVRASKGKVARAEPVAALYEQGRVRHLKGLDQLEEQMCRMTPTGFDGRGSPDRVDALVWALFDLMVEPGQKWSTPSIRAL